MSELQDHERAMNRAKFKLAALPDSVFFTTLAFSLRHVFDDSVPTAATNGKIVKYNPEFFMSLTADERVFLILHETMHCAYMHMIRAKERGMDPRKANIAADHVINLQLIDRGFKMPKCGLADRAYAGMSMEEVYAVLPESQEPPPMEDLEDPGEDSPDVQRDLEDIVIRAAMQSKMANNKPGSIPGDIEIFINKLLNPKLPWHAILRKYLQAYNKCDYSWTRPNRRFMPQHYLPSMRGQALIDLAIAVDASGSVSDDDFKQFVSDICGIFKMLKPKKISLIQFDTVIHSVDEVHSLHELMNVKFAGRGGTAIEPVLEWAEANQPQVLLVFTDGEFSFPASDYKPDSIWLIHNNPNWKSPIGKTIHYTL